jgi:hypothetical protein
MVLSDDGSAHAACIAHAGTMAATASGIERRNEMSDNTNTTDATRGQSLRARVEARKQELESALVALGPDDRARHDIEQALGEVSSLLTGDLDRIPRIVAEQLNSWLEANKHVNEWHPAEDVVATVAP